MVHSGLSTFAATEPLESRCGARSHVLLLNMCCASGTRPRDSECKRERPALLAWLGSWGRSLAAPCHEPETNAQLPSGQQLAWLEFSRLGNQAGSQECEKETDLSSLTSQHLVCMEEGPWPL